MDRGSRESDRPTLRGDELPQRSAAWQHVTGLPSSNAVTARKRTNEMLALIEAEQLLARTNQSGVRAVAPEIAHARDPSTAVTAVHRAIELDAMLPPSIQVTVVVNETLVLGPPSRTRDDDGVLASNRAPVSPTVAQEPSEFGVSAPSWVPSISVGAAPSVRPQPPRPSHRGRRILAAMLFAVIMAGTVVLLAVALSRAAAGSRAHELVRGVLQRVR